MNTNQTQKTKPTKYISPKEFQKMGYLQELNRQFLHPLGLALAVDVDKNIINGIWDYRDDPEGMYYDLKNSKPERIERFKKNSAFVHKEKVSKLDARAKMFGSENSIHHPEIEPID